MEKQILRLQSKTDNLSQVESLIDEVCEEWRVGEDNYGNILIAVTEAVNNAIQHGNKLDAEKSFEVEVDSTEAQITFRVRDEGPGFDFENLPDPTDPQNIENPHGRGIFLMRHLADEVEFQEEGRLVELRFKLTGS